MKYEKNRENFISRSFFTKPRPTISMEEALKDVIPVKWSKKVAKNKKKVIIGLAKKTNLFNKCLSL